ncbi:MAG: hypothetical protein D3909_04975 [Candidatus Electrothrix sp. ATG1]|nr:hypothetical protein [Candidatus Electrothrix sp. ATG1]
MDTVKTISAQVERLPLKLQEEVLHFVRQLVGRNRRETSGKERDSDTVPPRRSILELRGLGKHLWKDTSVKQYINAERDAWDG